MIKNIAIQVRLIRQLIEDINKIQTITLPTKFTDILLECDEICLEITSNGLNAFNTNLKNKNDYNALYEELVINFDALIKILNYIILFYSVNNIDRIIELFELNLNHIKQIIIE